MGKEEIRKWRQEVSRLYLVNYGFTWAMRACPVSPSPSGSQALGGVTRPSSPCFSPPGVLPAPEQRKASHLRCLLPGRLVPSSSPGKLPLISDSSLENTSWGLYLINAWFHVRAKLFFSALFLAHSIKIGWIHQIRKWQVTIFLNLSSTRLYLHNDKVKWDFCCHKYEIVQCTSSYKERRDRWLPTPQGQEMLRINIGELCSFLNFW